ncbi:MAG: glycosyl transferase [Candidatus Sungbacteria bacterium RIFCSPHIGHO2_02_FULL_49_12]|uniref:Glycosyl transferase n=1 Tax=Candidatus Sungbacteria bacterium RIFCSPHIGHO2_02_FULL_49_12 TaxID=1802271 RepID=A0A1G2KR58_9BACT|nr:MAG: glycosyl transferase [Candidatus Sungbacteria bacterium RIFCSPHIGHO2_02_FULL_49_12]
MMVNPQISIIVPVYNEEKVIPELLRRLVYVLAKLSERYEILFIDDGSRDSTGELLYEAAKNNAHLRVLQFSRNFGHQSAVSAGLDHVSGEAAVIIDGDLQDPPEIIPMLIEEWSKGYDVVYGVRVRRKEWWGKRLAYFLFYRLLKRIAVGVDLPLDSGDFALISRPVIDVIKSMPERNRYVRGLRSWAGFKQVGVSYERDARFAGEAKYTFSKLLKLAYDGIFSFSYMPLTLITYFGFAASFVSFLAIILILYFKLFTSYSLPGFASTASMILFLGGAQLMALGVIGEYIKRIYDETKQRPHYIISKKIGF